MAVNPSRNFVGPADKGEEHVLCDSHHGLSGSVFGPTFLVILLQLAFMLDVSMLQSGSSPFPWCVLLFLTHVGHFFFFFDAAAEVLPNEVDALLREVSEVFTLFSSM